MKSNLIFFWRDRTRKHISVNTSKSNTIFFCKKKTKWENAPAPFFLILVGLAQGATGAVAPLENSYLFSSEESISYFFWSRHTHKGNGLHMDVRYFPWKNFTELEGTDKSPSGRQSNAAYFKWRPRQGKLKSKCVSPIFPWPDKKNKIIKKSKMKKKKCCWCCEREIGAA
jgi:hypothetical protein